MGFQEGRAVGAAARAIKAKGAVELVGYGGGVLVS